MNKSKLSIFHQKIKHKRAEIHMNVDKFCGKKVFVCKTRKCLWEQCFLKM